MKLMSGREWKRIDVVKRIEGGMLTTEEGARALGLCPRQVRRIRRAVERSGQDGVRHGNRGRPPSNRCQEEQRTRVLELFKSKYAGFNDQHFTEKLVDVEKIKISRPTVQRWLRAAGLMAARKRRAPKHRRRRDRKPQAGLMILWDGSRHAWLEDRGPMMCLMGAVDDATSELLPGAHFVDQECSAGYLTTLRAIVKGKGVPCSAYMDRHGSLRRNDDNWTLEEELRGEQDPTQVGKALKDLNVTPIFALSPQAKGRVERVWGTLQDRLVSELRLAKASTMQAANDLLALYLPNHNRLFAVPAAEATPAWKRLGSGVDVDLVCSFRYDATVNNDNTVRISGHVIDIPPGPGGRSYARARVDVRQLLDGSWRVIHKGKIIAIAEATTTQELRAKPQRKRSAASRAFRAAVLSIAVSLP